MPGASGRGWNPRRAAGPAGVFGLVPGQDAGPRLVPGRKSRLGAPSSNTCRPLARDHAAPESTLPLAKAASLGRERVRPLAWCSRPRSSAALLEGALVAKKLILIVIDGLTPAAFERAAEDDRTPALKF